MTAPTQRPGRDATLLATLADELNPEQPPFYVSGSTGGQPDGWYWVPAGENRPRYLGRNVMWSEKRLLEMLRNAG